ncbi:hypothetical protein IWW50_006232, partial [Coemansia erecta]
SGYLYEYAPESQSIECIAQSVDGDTEQHDIYRAVEWSPDGTVLAASTDDSTLQLYDLNAVVTQYAAQLPAPTELRMQTSIAHGGTLLDYAWYPYMSRHDTATCCLIESVREHPTQLRDIHTRRVRASYSAYDSKDVLMSATAVAFSRDAASIHAGYMNHIGRFDVQRPGLPVELEPTSPSRRSRDGMKGIVSCVAPGASALACGSFGGHVGLYSAGTAMCVWRVPDEYRGGGVTDLRWAPNDVHLWAGSRQSRFLVAWDIRDLRGPWAVIPRAGLTQQRMHFDFDATGKYLIAGQTDGRIEFHNVEAPDSDPVSVQAHGDLVAGISAHPYYPLLATASGQRRFDHDPASTEPANCLRVWSVPATYFSRV